MILLALYACSPLAAADRAGGNDHPADRETPLVETEADFARKAYEKEMNERTARLRAQRPSTSGRVPPAPLNPEGDLPPAREAPATIEESDRLRAERASRAAFTPEQMLERAGRPERQPEHIRNAPADDMRFMRPKLIEAHRGKERPDGRSEIEEITALRREIRKLTGASDIVPPAQVKPPAEAVVITQDR
ncbi:MAG: hypothetical protein ACREIA_05695 [Opitutaceae bacterium]